MSKLADLKTAAASKLASVHADVTTYITALESSVSSNKKILIGVGVACLIVGGLIGHAL